MLEIDPKNEPPSWHSSLSCKTTNSKNRQRLAAPLLRYTCAAVLPSHYVCLAARRDRYRTQIENPLTQHHQNGGREMRQKTQKVNKICSFSLAITRHSVAKTPVVSWLPRMVSTGGRFPTRKGPPTPSLPYNWQTPGYLFIGGKQKVRWKENVSKRFWISLSCRLFIKLR